MSNNFNTGSVKSHFIKINDINIFYKEYGNGKPLILLHGGTGTMSMWNDLIKSFSGNFRVITPDNRGHGRTDNPNGEMNYHLLADDIATFIKKLNLNRPLVCGYSDGGQIALELGIRYPGLCKALVIGAAWYKFSDNYKESLTKFGFIGKNKIDINLIQKEQPELVEEWKNEHSQEGDPKKWLQVLNQVSKMWWTEISYRREDLNKITAPCLVLMGDRDGFIPIEQVFDMYNFIPDSELAILPNKNHISVFKEPGPFIASVNDFLIRNS